MMLAQSQACHQRLLHCMTYRKRETEESKETDRRRVFYDIISHLCKEGNPAPNETIYRSDEIGEKKKKKNKRWRRKKTQKKTEVPETWVYLKHEVRRKRKKRKRWKIETQGSSWKWKREGEQEGEGECAMKKGVQGNLCSWNSTPQSGSLL